MTEERVAVGLMAGTSADGIDAAVVRVTRNGDDVSVATLGALTCPYAATVRARVLAAREADATELARLDVLLGERFAAAAHAAIDRAGVAPADVDVIGSHGQTVVHLPGEAPAPDGARHGAVTLQIARAAVIAERVGRPVVADFRSRDAAAGGEGAPLVPYVDWLLLRPDRGARLVLNLGGVANVTLVTPDLADVRAFDTGPANGPLDAAATAVSGGAATCDTGGARAARGRVDEREVLRLLEDAWLRTPPPRSASRERWGEPFVAALRRRRADLCDDDLLATLTAFVARSVADACRRHLMGAVSPGDVVVSGGGVHNATLMHALGDAFAPVPVRSSAALGIDPDHREAVAFAVLAVEFLAGRAANLPAVTGARGPRVLGALYP